MRPSWVSGANVCAILRRAPADRNRFAAVNLLRSAVERHTVALMWTSPSLRRVLPVGHLEKPLDGLVFLTRDGAVGNQLPPHRARAGRDRQVRQMNEHRGDEATGLRRAHTAHVRLDAGDA
jgi:16S rRNA U516 pseudouridylate synthase RsuA-like enzyme